MNLYKLFLEAAHALLRPGGRLGFVVPSGLYSDNGTGALRRLFIERCRWEWLFGIENRDKIFPIHRSYKFNPVIIEKGEATQAIRAVFMRRNLDDWDRAEDLATLYTRQQVEQFSPRSRAILEIQSKRDLEILEKIYSNSVLLGDDGPDGWGIRYATEFHMTNDSHLFPPRPQWEAKGYRPDEYSRWLLGDWRPIEELWEELGVDPSQPEPVEVELEEWLFDGSAGPERREAEARFVHGHWLKPGDVERTEWRMRCARPPYDGLPVARASVPPRIIFSRECDAWIREEDVQDTAVPFFEGRMIGQFDFAQKGWVSGKGRGAIWREIPWECKEIEPQFLMRRAAYESAVASPWSAKLTHMNIGSATNIRSAIGSLTVGMPTGHSAPTFRLPTAQRCLGLTGIFNSIVFDFVTRARVTGLHLDFHVLEQNPLPRFLTPAALSAIVDIARKLSVTASWAAPVFLTLELWNSKRADSSNALTDSQRLRLTATLDASIAASFGLEYDDVARILSDCDHRGPSAQGGLNPKGFWRIGKDSDPELRHTVLTLIAFHDLEAKIEAAGGDREKGIEAFLSQNHGEGWLLPETLRPADYALGHDDRAEQPQPVASRLGPRFYDWQFVQSADESRLECHLHSRNLLGVHGYATLLVDLIARRIANGEDYLDLLTDSFTHKLAGADGYVTILLELRARQALYDAAYWTLITNVRNNHYLDESSYGELLDKLHTRKLLDDLEYSRRSGRNAPTPEDEPLSQVAEQESTYDAKPEEKDLFD